MPLIASDTVTVVPVGPPSTEPTVDVPHFAYPFAFDATGQAQVLQQGTVDEVAACVANIAACPQGFRTDAPDFGIPDPTGETLPLDTSQIAQAIRSQEPRAQVTVLAPVDPTDPSDQQVTVNVEIAG